MTDEAKTFVIVNKFQERVSFLKPKKKKKKKESTRFICISVVLGQALELNWFCRSECLILFF